MLDLGKPVVGAADDAIGKRMRATEGRAVTDDRLVRDVIVVFGLDDQDIAAISGTGAQGAVFLERDGGSPVGGEY
ncbi:hypothetical protein KXV85_002959, partial [Aspergillus fumigatus]